MAHYTATATLPVYNTAVTTQFLYSSAFQSLLNVVEIVHSSCL